MQRRLIVIKICSLPKASLVRLQGSKGFWRHVDPSFQKRHEFVRGLDKTCQESEQFRSSSHGNGTSFTMAVSSNIHP